MNKFNYIGLDAHSATCTFVCIDQDGVEKMKARVQTSELNIKQFLRSINGPKALVFEESTMAKWLHAITYNEVDELTVCHPGYMAKKPGPKNDYRDARHSAHELRKGHLVSVFHSNDNIYIPLRTIVSSYVAVTGDIVRNKNRLKAIFRAQGKKETGSTLYNNPDKIEELEGEYNQFTADSLLYQIQLLEEVKLRHVDHFQDNMKKYKILKLLDTIPQVDAIRANIIAAYTCDGARFQSKHQYWAYIGLVRYCQESDGQSYGNKKVHGSSELKNVFMGMAEGSLKGQTSIRKYYDQLRSKCLDHKKAKKAVARRLAAIALAVFKTEKPYDDNFEEKKKKVIKKKI